MNEIKNDMQNCRIGITQGDINGVGYEVIAKALGDYKILELCTPVVYGLSKAAAYHKKYLNLPDFSFHLAKSPEQASSKRPNLINLYEEEVKIELGASTATAGEMSERALYASGRDLKSGAIDAIVTGPVNVNNMQSERFAFAGQTEFFGHYFGDGSHKAMMMTVGESLRIGFATNHLPVEKVPAALNTETLTDRLKLLDHTLRRDFAVDNPKIAVLALNPNAGSEGRAGDEERLVICPAVEKAFDAKINAFGPFPADSFFADGKYREFDSVLAMYHDQGMIPFRILCPDGVEFTAGLPVVRTAPVHGVQYGIAGRNMTDGQGMRNAIYCAIDILRNRAR